MSDDAERIVPVVIHGQRYPVKSALNPAYVAELAAYVDEKIRVASDENQTNDSLRVAVLAALNLADEVFRYRQDRAPALVRSLAPHAEPGTSARHRITAPGTRHLGVPPGTSGYNVLALPCFRDGQERRLSQCITQANRNVAPCARLR